MNDVLMLKGHFEKESAPKIIPHLNIPEHKSYDTEKMKRLLFQLINLKNYWQGDTTIPGALVSVHYIEVIAKSNRLKCLLSDGRTSNENVVGARYAFAQENSFPSNHIITYNVSLEGMENSIRKLGKAIQIIDKEYNGKINKDTISIIESYRKADYPFKNEISKSDLLNILNDCCYVDSFEKDASVRMNDILDATVLTFYDVGVPAYKLLEKIGIKPSTVWDENTFLFRKADAVKVVSEYPWFISMATVDINEIRLDDLKMIDDDGRRKLPKPSNEPIVGVIDTAFDKRAYFSEWVDYKDTISEMPLEEEDYYHGTSVSSIIVDGPYLNPQYDDGCGFIKVRHFRVAKSGSFSSSFVIRKIRDIVRENGDIKVWNLSLGSKLPIKDCFISPEAAVLDKIQNEYDVIFVVSGTNIPKGKSAPMKIGAPADSLNSLTVNAVKYDKTAASYSRTGPVLAFFYKPDVSYYGGDKEEEDYIHTCIGISDAYLAGTSFAAPWISRKMAYLIGKMGLSREAAKALLIDSAAGWDRQDSSPSSMLGYGVVPTRIEDIISTKNDEIRFLLTGTIDSYTTYTYNLPIPIVNNAQPYYARATLCYSPICDRKQGVDYTNTEMDIHFGRVYADKKGKVQIKSINGNTQSDEIKQSLSESNARTNYRKWDNIKHINETIKSRSKPKKIYENGLWGLSIKAKERTEKKWGRGLHFGVVVTLKEMFGVNRINEFIQQCQFRGWLVNRLSVENMNTINLQAEEEIEFDE